MFDNLFSLVVFGAGNARGHLDFVSTSIRGGPLVFVGSRVQVTGFAAAGPPPRGQGR